MVAGFRSSGLHSPLRGCLPACPPPTAPSYCPQPHAATTTTLPRPFRPPQPPPMPRPPPPLAWSPHPPRIASPYHNDHLPPLPRPPCSPPTVAPCHHHHHPLCRSLGRYISVSVYWCEPQFRLPEVVSVLRETGACDVCFYHNRDAWTSFWVLPYMFLLRMFNSCIILLDI